MSGIYIHIPFCKTRCSYCDFFTQTDEKLKDLYIGALCNELILRKNYLNNETVETIYFGGGTPSRLSESDFNKIFNTIYKYYDIASDNEITIEANPDDLNSRYIDTLCSLPINRISIGIQSFNDDELSFLNRRHSAEDAKIAVLNCQSVGFKNISIDLMYGLPNQTGLIWKQNLHEALNLNIQHISAYHLIYEEGTKMEKLIQTGKITPLSEETSINMFSTMNSTLKEGGFIHYEISNFAKEGFLSRHNTSYWLGKKYIGIGTAAHSFDGKCRSWNVASIKNYIESITSGHLSFEREELTLKEKYNDYILTRLRTIWGADTNEIEKLFGKKLLSYCLDNISTYIKNEDVDHSGNKIKITEKGLFISDRIMSDLMYIG